MYLHETKQKRDLLFLISFYLSHPVVVPVPSPTPTPILFLVSPSPPHPPTVSRPSHSQGLCLDAGHLQPSSIVLVTHLCPESYANEVSDSVPFR